MRVPVQATMEDGARPARMGSYAVMIVQLALQNTNPNPLVEGRRLYLFRFTARFGGPDTGTPRPSDEVTQALLRGAVIGSQTLRFRPGLVADRCRARFPPDPGTRRTPLPRRGRSDGRSLRH